MLGYTNTPWVQERTFVLLDTTFATAFFAPPVFFFVRVFVGIVMIVKLVILRVFFARSTSMESALLWAPHGRAHAGH